MPEFLYRAFILARSKGEYFSTRINSRFRSEEVLADDEKCATTGDVYQNSCNRTCFVAVLTRSVNLSAWMSAWTVFAEVQSDSC